MRKGIKYFLWISVPVGVVVGAGVGIGVTLGHKVNKTQLTTLDIMNLQQVTKDINSLTR